MIQHLKAMEKEHIKRNIKTNIKNIEVVKKKHLQIAMGAAKLFTKEGYPQTSIREISKAAGLTIGNLYDYITKKQDVLYLVFDVFHSMWAERLKDKGISEIEDPIRQLMLAIQRMLAIVNTHRDMVLLMYTETKLLPKDFLKIILGKESRLVGYFEKILKRGIKKGVFKKIDPFFLANIIVYMLSMEPLRGWNLRKRYKVGEINEYIIEFIKRCILK
jgi:AcrR family transcriptional regulator